MNWTYTMIHDWVLENACIGHSVLFFPMIPHTMASLFRSL